MASKTVKPKNKDYGVIQRGCSLTIPVVIKDTFEKPLDLTDCMASFTVKEVRTDYDMKDARAFIQKDFTPQEPEQGRFFIQLTSEDTDIPPGCYYFDVEIKKPDTGMIYRLCTLNCEIEGGPTNRHINNGIGQLPVGDEISVITLPQGAPIVIIAPAVAISPNVYNEIEELKEKVEALERKTDYQGNAIQVLVEHVQALNDAINP